MLTHYNHQQLFRKYTKKFHHHGVFKCTNYFSSFLFQQHNEVLQQNKKEKYSEHIAFMNSYLEKYTKKFYHQGLYKCSNYFSCLLLQHHTEVLQQNRKEKYCEHITFMNSYLEKYTKNSIIKEYISVQFTFPFFYFNNTLRCCNKVKRKIL